MFETADSHELDFVVSRLSQLRYSELGPEPGKVFVIRDSHGSFLRCFYQGRPLSTSFLCHALLFDNLRLCATFGKFWGRIAVPGKSAAFCGPSAIATHPRYSYCEVRELADPPGAGETDLEIDLKTEATLKKAITLILTIAAIILVFSLVWMNRYEYVKSTGEGYIKVMRINRFTGRYQYTQMRGDGVWTDNIGEHPKAEAAVTLPPPRP